MIDANLTYDQVFLDEVRNPNFDMLLHNVCAVALRSRKRPDCELWSR
jgi:hypothetical protein